MNSLLDALTQPTFGEPLWIEILRWGIVAVIWIFLCSTALWAPGLVKVQLQHARLARRGRRRPKTESHGDALYRA